MYNSIVYVTNDANPYVDSYCINHEQCKSTCRLLPYNPNTIEI